MFSAALLVTAKKKKKKQKQLRCPYTYEWTNKMGSIHIMEYYRAIKGNEVLTQATTYMNLNNYAERPDTKGYTLFDFVSMRC